MKIRFVFLALILTIVVLPVSAEKPTASTVERTQLLNLDQHWQQAVVNGDTGFLEKWTADDFHFTHWGKNTFDSKTDWIQWAQQTPRHFLQRRVSDQSLEIHGDAAWVFGRLDVRTLGANQNPDHSLCYAIEYVHLYGLRNGQWMFLSHRTTQSLEASHPCPQSNDK